MAPLPVTLAGSPLFAQGDTTENPRPVPKDSRMSERAAATNAPATIAAHDTPEALASFFATLKGKSRSIERGKDCADNRCLLNEVPH
jgi:hypothetical protein